ncbi:MAG: hypothetical protein R3274_11740 [Desulfobacterales bacterium]|nr:hypothetical protein [Desulfobacterales bacterium]
MIKKRLLDQTRIRCISGGFSFIPHRFLTGGFLAALDPSEALLYFLLVLAADRRGLSFYSYDRICSILKLSVEQYVDARQGLIRKDLIAFDGTLFQVLQLPEKPALDAGSPPEPIAALRQLAKQIGREVSDENR